MFTAYQDDTVEAMTEAQNIMIVPGWIWLAKFWRGQEFLKHSLFAAY